VIIVEDKGGPRSKPFGNCRLEKRSMMDIVSVQGGNILDWFLNDAGSVAAALIHVEESSARQVKCYRFRKHKFTSLLNCQEKSTYTTMGRPRKGFYENEVSVNYAV